MPHSRSRIPLNVFKYHYSDDLSKLTSGDRPIWSGARGVSGLSPSNTYCEPFFTANHLKVQAISKNSPVPPHKNVILKLIWQVFNIVIINIYGVV